MSTDIEASYLRNPKHHMRRGFSVEVPAFDEEESDRRSQKRTSMDTAKRLEAMKMRSLQNWRNAGPPMFIREQSGMSIVSDFTSDFTYDGNNSGGHQSQQRMTQIRECSQGTLSFATVGVSDEDKNEKSDMKDVPKGRPAKNSHQNELGKMIEESHPPESYVRQLEIDLINLKMKMAHAQSQIDEHQLMAKKEQSNLREYKDQIEREKHVLELENMKLKCELEEERASKEKMILKITEQNRVILHLKEKRQHQHSFS